ncbi:unnamed protein product [Blepharisma stoltei]|uniref:EIF-4F 25 kDa subunit n=1 Tax=Blepharisma stoltei TaxID=1481888 RepID=A0AAU9JJI5_9CILI|nr:unnamed protein product [Blepharisma stoltei]
MGHELEYPWSLYVTRSKKKTSQQITLQAWEERLKKIGTFKEAEEFWQVYNNIKVPTDIYGRGDYYLFKGDVLPEWEHPANANGGAWILRTEYMEKINEQWLNTQLGLIGCFFLELMPHICGTEMCVRMKRFRICLWIDTIEENIAMEIGRKFKELIGQETGLEFKKHFDEKILYTL